MGGHAHVIQNMRSHLPILYVLVAIAISIGAYSLLETRATHELLSQVNEQVAFESSTTERLAQAERSRILAPNTGGSASSNQTAPTTDPLTSAVAKTAPAVVSIVISKEMPDLQVQYVNPFGNDPTFQHIGLRIPVYKQSGTSEQQVGAGSGFIVTNNGKILTNKHVVADPNASYTVLLSSGAQKTAKVIYRDPNVDVAVLQIDGSYPTTASLGDSSSLKLGQTVIAIGNALGQYSNSVSRGIISGLNRTVQASDAEGNSETLSNVIQTDAAINLGNSGGPLVDLNGRVIGINVATVVGSSNINFALPINSVTSLVAPYLK